MTPNEIVQNLKNKFPDKILGDNIEVIEPYIMVASPDIPEIILYLKNTPELSFDFLNLITGIDWNTDNRMEVVYHLSSIPHHHQLTVKCYIPRLDGKVPSIAHIYGAANWHERETYDMFGIVFEGHPDLRRILCPDDWDGFPLRKDYQFPEEYHGIKWA